VYSTALLHSAEANSAPDCNDIGHSTVSVALTSNVYEDTGPIHAKRSWTPIRQEVTA
jgi:hypothetical protein